MAYNLNLHFSVMIHLIFHFSQLKKLISNKVVQTQLPNLPMEPLLQPQTMLDRRIVKGGNSSTTQVLIY
jgi:hypothetical protein